MKLDKRMLLYAESMEEIKNRFRIIREDTQAIKLTDDHPRKIALGESCFLQPRFVCELIALSALTVHEPEDVSNELLKKYHAGAIFAKLVHINATCFPVAVTADSEPNSYVIEAEMPVTIEGLKDIYNGCGSALHRGALINMRDQPKHYDIDQLVRWANSLITLLNKHMIFLNDESQVVLVDLTGAEGGRVLIAHADVTDIRPS